MAIQSSKNSDQSLPLKARDRQALSELFQDFDSENLRQIDTALSYCFQCDAIDETAWISSLQKI